ncbi:MAG: hypothetical protein ACOZAR_01695 [Patescibacteria group bacterium]
MKFKAKKKIVIVCVQLLIALGLVIGADWASDSFHRFFHGYYADIVLPLGFYFLLKTLEDKYTFLRPWYRKATAVFLLVSTSEILQYFGIYALASIFDPFDFLAYASGVLSAAFIDRVIFTKMFNFWN